ncbi:MAG: SPFH domain-containing protein [Bacteroidota bacterium]
MKKIKITTFFIAAMLLLQNCATVRPGEAGVDIHYGKIQNNILQPGPHHVLALFGKKIVRFNTREINYSVTIDFHTKEGIDVKSEITVLYHLNIDSIISIYKKYGTDYQSILIQDNIITALRQTGLAYVATELITQRNDIEKTIKSKLEENVGRKGFVFHSVMLKQIELPLEIEQTIRAQLNAEETAKKIKLENEVAREQLVFQLEKSMKEKQQDLENQRLTLDFNIEKQKKENERLLLEAEALKKQYEILSSSLTENLLKYKALEITRELIKSPNAKVIITDGKSPVILNGEK